ncbi:MAG: hypothetical protein LBD97_02555 [Bifidobacteriaceae bacterium]|nr:hypothetical protein [Bifidobacteriaceae bacterium]
MALPETDLAWDVGHGARTSAPGIGADLGGGPAVDPLRRSNGAWRRAQIRAAARRIKAQTDNSKCRRPRVPLVGVDAEEIAEEIVERARRAGTAPLAERAAVYEAALVQLEQVLEKAGPR